MANPPPATPTPVSDPIRAKYFKALENAEKCNDLLFYLVALLSIGVLFIEKGEFPSLFAISNAAFATLVALMFVIGLTIRLYFYPRAEDMRRKDFFAKATGVQLSHVTTSGYYNNNFVDPIKRIAAQTLESSFFSKNIVLHMLHRERAIYGIYALAFVGAVFYRRTDISFIVAAAQVLFSEQIIARLVRLEWVRSRFENTYDNLYTLFQSTPADAVFLARTLEIQTGYEATKSNAGITLSSSHFKANRDELGLQWDAIKAALGM